MRTTACRDSADLQGASPTGDELGKDNTDGILARLSTGQADVATR